LIPDDESILKNVKAVLDGLDADWWDDLTDEAKASVERGLKESERGELHLHEEVMKNYK
jgi:predicted transcriptional regulator